MSDQYPSRVAEKIVVRLPDGMRDRLAEAAKSNNRSTNAEVVARLEASFAAADIFAGGVEAAPEVRATLREAVDMLSAVVETPEILENILSRRAASPEAADDLRARLRKVSPGFRRMGDEG